MKEQIRPLYSELQGYLSQAPENDGGSLHEESTWGQFHTTIDELNNISGKDYNKFKVQPQPMASGRGSYVLVSQYRTKLSGLISRLYGEYFSDESAPFSGMPSTVITQNQHQSQNVQILLEIQSIIDQKLAETKDETEKSFLQKIKTKLSSVKSVGELISLILSTGTALGLTLEQIYKLFK